MFKFIETKHGHVRLTTKGAVVIIIVLSVLAIVIEVIM